MSKRSIKKKISIQKSEVPIERYSSGKDDNRTLCQLAWSWGAVCGFSSLLFTGGISFMIAVWPYIADLFFFIGCALLLAKFLSWDIPRYQERKNNLIQRVAIAITLFIIVIAIAIGGNHYLNNKKHTRAFAQIDAPEVVEKKFSAIIPGRQLGFNIWVSNVSSERIFNIYHYSRLGIIRGESVNSKINFDKTEMDSFNKEQKTLMRQYLSGELSGNDLGIGQKIFSTVGTEPPLTDELCKGLFDGSVRLYIVSWCAWKDGEGNVDTTSACRWLQILRRKSSNVYSNKDFVWHICQ